VLNKGKISEVSEKRIVAIEWMLRSFNRNENEAARKNNSLISNTEYIEPYLNFTEEELIKEKFLVRTEKIQQLVHENELAETNGYY
jgi:hypothetical protein